LNPRGLLSPFRRDRKRDFASDDGDALLASKVMQVLGTESASASASGELPWRTAFGTPLQRLRHMNNDVALAELARVYVRDALRTWIPEVALMSALAARDDSTLSLRVRVRSRVSAGPAASVEARISMEP
jgi:phage baseplate assembly protein W